MKHRQDTGSSGLRNVQMASEYRDGLIVERVQQFSIFK